MRSLVFEFDYPTSVLASFHTLHAPTEEGRLYNKRLFEQMEGSLARGDARLYRSFLRMVGINKQGREAFKRMLFLPEKNDLNNIVESLMSDIPRNALKESILGFGVWFRAYWTGLTEELNPAMAGFIRASVEGIDRIFEETQALTGEKIEQPDNISIRFVEGLGRNFFSKRQEGGGIYLAEPVSCLEEDFPARALYALVNETAPRMIAERYYATAEEFLPEKADEVTDCLARAIAGKVYRNVFKGTDVVPKEFRGVGDRAIEEDTEKLPSQDFERWYRGCLQKKLDKSEC